MDDKVTWGFPDARLDSNKPDDEVLESTKFENDGDWFLRYGRHIVKEYYNPQVKSFGTLQAIVRDITEYRPLRYCDEMKENLSFYFGQQENNSYALATQSPTGGAVMARHVPGQKIFQLVSNMEGPVQGIIKPLKRSISAISLTSETIEEKMALANKVRVNAIIQKELNGLKAVGVRVDNGIPQFESESELEEFVANIRHDHEIRAVNDAKAVYFKNRLDTQFFYDYLYQANAGICGTEIVERGNDVYHNQVPAFNLIWDFRCKDPYFRDAQVVGKIEWKTPQEILSENPECFRDPVARKQLENFSKTNTNECKGWMTYYNDGWGNCDWWKPKDNKVGEATLYWIGKKNLRYRIKTDKSGTYPSVIKDDAFYDTNEGRVKGSQLKGDDSVWAVHYVKIIGNKWATHYGYFPYQIKAPYKQAVPELPIFLFAHRFLDGHFRAMVSRGKENQKLKDLYKIKIQELVGRDRGRNHIIDGSVLGETEDAVSIVDDFAQMGITVVQGVSGPAGTQGEKNKFVEVVDMTLDPNIKAYIELCMHEDREMGETFSIPPSMLGQDSGMVLKGVQEGRIQQASMGNVSFFEGLMEFWRLKLQFSVNLVKWIKTKNGESEEVGQISTSEAAILKYTEGYRNEDLLLFIQANDTIEGNKMRMLQQALQAYGQNPEIGYEAVLNIMMIMEKETYRESIEYLRNFVAKKKEEGQKALAEQNEQARLNAAEQQGLAEMQRKAAAYEKLMLEISKITLKGSWDSVVKSEVTPPEASAIAAQSSQETAQFIQTTAQGGETAQAPTQAAQFAQ